MKRALTSSYDVRSEKKEREGVFSASSSQLPSLEEMYITEVSFLDHFRALPVLSSKIHSPWTSRTSSPISQKLGKEWNERISPLFEIGSKNLGREKKKRLFAIGMYLRNIVAIMVPDKFRHSDTEGLNDPHWEKVARSFWSFPRWAEILYLTGLDRKKTISKSNCRRFQNHLSSFIDWFKISNKESKNQSMIERLAFDLMAYLSTHKLDPFNLFLGACPSESFSRSFRSIGSSPDSSKIPRSPPLSSSSFRSPSLLARPSPRLLPMSKNLFVPVEITSPSPPLLPPPAMKTDNVNTEEKENKSPNNFGLKQIESSYIDLVMRWNSFLNFPDQILKEISVVAENVQKSQCWGTGCLVAVEVDALPPGQRKWFTNPNWKKVWDCRFIFCRIASHHFSKNHGGSVDIFVDPFERESIRVVASSVFTFDHPKELKEELTVFNQKWFSRPSDLFFNQSIELIEEVVKKFLGTDSKTSNHLSNFEEVSLQYKVKSSISSSRETKSRILSQLSWKIKQLFEKWASDVPHGLVCPPRLSFYAHMIDELLKSFPKMVSQEIESHLTLAKTRLQSFTKRLQMVINGTSKNDVCSWWLNHIHEETDQFLKKQGFDLEALPPDYTDTPPKDISIVERNQQILMELLKVDEDNGDRGDDGDDGKCDGESKHSDESLDQFVDETVQRVYERLDELMSEMEFVLQRGWESFILDEFRFEYSESDFDSLRKDYEYLKKVKAMDQQIKMEEKKGKEKKRVEMSEVVPVAGLVMARFHIYDCEISTILDLWGQKKIAFSKSHVAFPAEYLSICERKRKNTGTSKMIEPAVSRDELSEMRQGMCSFLQDSSRSSLSSDYPSLIDAAELPLPEESGARGFLEFCLETKPDSPTPEDDLDDVQFENTEGPLLSPEVLIFGERSQKEAAFVEEPQQPISSPKKSLFFWRSPPPKKRPIANPVERGFSFSNQFQSVSPPAFPPQNLNLSPPSKSKLQKLQQVSVSLYSQSSVSDKDRHSIHTPPLQQQVSQPFPFHGLANSSDSRKNRESKSYLSVSPTGPSGFSYHPSFPRSANSPQLSVNRRKGSSPKSPQRNEKRDN